MPATRRKGPARVKERDRGVTLWGRARPMMEGERAPLRDHAKRVGNRRKPASVCRDGHLTRKSKSKSKVLNGTLRLAPGPRLQAPKDAVDRAGR